MPKFSVDLEISTSIEIDADTTEDAARKAKGFVTQLEPTEAYIDGWNMNGPWISFFSDFVFDGVSATEMSEDEDD
jgi:hypothetical protein